MTAPHQHERGDLFEAYLDGLLNDAEQAAFAESLRADPAQRRQVELQSQIDKALSRLFAVETPSREQLAASLASAVANTAPSLGPATVLPAAAGKMSQGGRAYWAAAGLVAAAMVVGVLVSLLWRPQANDGPFFAARPLVDVYRDAVASGFEPTYECDEPERFAATFQQRQGQALQLLAMPSGARMLGLAYVGGLSRNTTAMLCYVEGRPVMVFVDRATDDRPDVAATPGDGLHVFRQQRQGLVFYEVTPLETPRVTSLLAPIASDAATTGI